MSKLNTAAIKQKFIDWLVPLGYSGDGVKNPSAEDIAWQNDYKNPKMWSRYHKSRVKNYDEDCDFLITEFLWKEAVWFNGQSIQTLIDEDIEAKMVAAVNQGENWIRNFSFRDGDNCHVTVITNPDDTEVIAMVYHQD